MEERVSSLGGRLEVTSTIGAGTGVRAFIPDPASSAPLPSEQGVASER